VIPNRQFLKNNIRPNCGARLGNADRDCQGKNKISAEMLLYVYDERFTQRNLHQKAMIAFLDGVSGVSYGMKLRVPFICGLTRDSPSFLICAVSTNAATATRQTRIQHLQATQLNLSKCISST
jgi:hypothetical protein